MVFKSMYLHIYKVRVMYRHTIKFRQSLNFFISNQTSLRGSSLKKSVLDMHRECAKIKAFGSSVDGVASDRVHSVDESESCASSRNRGLHHHLVLVGTEVHGERGANG